MNALRLPLSFSLLILMLTGCDWFRTDPPVEPLPGEVHVNFELEWEGVSYALEQVVSDHNGYPIRLDNLQLYIAPIAFRKDGDWVETTDVSLVDFSIHAPKELTSIPSGSYDAIRFGMGLPPEINTDIDPASYPNSHPLSVIGSAGMFWTWASGYIFVKYEGKFALEQGTPLLEPVSYHCGTDASYRTVTLELPSALVVEPEGEYNATLTLDAAKALHGTNDAIDLAVDPVTHNAQGDSLGGRMMDLLVDGWKIRVE